MLLRPLLSFKRTRLAARILAFTMLITLALSAAACAAPTPEALPQPNQPQATVPAAVEPTLLPSATAAPTETLPPTVTPLPSATPEPTATPTATATLGPAAENDFLGWCLPEGVSTVYIEDPFQPYLDSRILNPVKGLTPEQDGYEVRNLPSSGCVFVYQFNMPAPEGLTLAVYEPNGTEPFTTAPLAPVEGQPQAVSAIVTHSYVIAIPTWSMSYRFAVEDASGQELRSDTVNLHRWMPELCWNGALPDINTLRCPLQQDLHPWDAGYGTPMPTRPPE